jgi:hypothetical protein
MSQPIQLDHEIASAINGAALRGHALAVAYVDGDGKPSVSFRGSAQVLSGDQLAIWARKPDDGLAGALGQRPDLSLVYFGGHDGPGPIYLSIRGRGRVDASMNDTVYNAMIPGERDQDPDRRGVAVVIDVDSVSGVGAAGPFQMTRQ